MVCESVTKDNLKGVWPALLIPWTPDDEIDSVCLAQEMEHFAAAGVHGTYTGGTAGEFYALDDKLFEELTELACGEAKRCGLRIQIGCTALSTRAVRNRIGIARQYGASAIQLTLPFWMALTDKEVVLFFEEVAAIAEDTPIVFYQTLRAKRRIDPPLVGDLAQRIPNLIGIKDTGCDYQTLQDIRADAPTLAVFGTDFDLLERMRHGASGTYSSVAGMNPRLVLAIYEYCVAGRFDLAEPLQSAVRRLMTEMIYPIAQESGLLDSALDRLQRVVGGGSIGLRCQPPYRSATEQDVERVRSWCMREAPILLELPLLKPHHIHHHEGSKHAFSQPHFLTGKTQGTVK